LERAGGVSVELFQKILPCADGSMVGCFAAAGDHPVLVPFPEEDYLGGLLLRCA
jgi:hypothetical protein